MDEILLKVFISFEIWNSNANSSVLDHPACYELCHSVGNEEIDDSQN
jgi:hypothetical protein